MPKGRPQPRDKRKAKKTYGSARVRKLVDELVQSSESLVLLEDEDTERAFNGARNRLLSYIHNLEVSYRKLRSKPKLNPFNKDGPKGSC